MTDDLREIVASALHGALSRVDVMRYLEMPEGTADVLADAALTALAPIIAAREAAAVESALASHVLAIDCDALIKQAASDATFEERRMTIQWLLNGISGGAKMPSAIASSIAHGAHLETRTAT
jgi:hypothetical protein